MTIATLLAYPQARVLFALGLTLLSGGLGACRSEDPPHAAADTRSSALEPAATAPNALPPVSSRPAPPGTADRLAATHAGLVSPLRVTGVLAGDVLNIRSQPDGDSAVVGSIPPNTSGIEGLAPPETMAKTQWQKVRYGSIVGWVNARFLAADDGSLRTQQPPQRAAANGPQGTPSALTPLACFGNEPYWMIEFGADGSATCSETCEGPSGLRVSGLETSPQGEPEIFDILTAKGTTYLRAVIKRTGQCSDGMSDTSHPYMFSAVGVPGELTGCCRVKE